MGFFGPSKKEKELQMEIEHLRSMLSPEGAEVVDLQEKIAHLRHEMTDIELLVNEEQKKLTKAQKQLSITEQKCRQLEGDIVNLQSDIGAQDYGLYRPTYKFANSDLYKDKLKALREQQKQLIKSGQACTGNMTWTVNGDLRKGKKMVADMQKLLLRAFNVECDDIVSNVKISNFNTSLQRIRKIADQVSKLGTIMSISITPKYIKLRRDEVALALDFEQKKQEEKEQIREAKAREREEARVQKEIEEERKRLQKEQTHYRNELQRVMDQLVKDPENLDLQHKRVELENNIADTDKAIADVDYREANKRAGYVYIISNIGAFGENMFKIGMTRRLDPMERIDELSSASVPFNFDVHALIFTEDAPGLEAALHRAFEKNKVNKINTRREFFRVSLNEIKAEVRKNFDKTVEWTDFPEADQYRQSLLLGGSPPKPNADTSSRIVSTQSTLPTANQSAIANPAATPPVPQQSLPEQIKNTLKDYRLQEEDNPAFLRLHVYDTNNRKLGIVKITKPDMKITFKVPGNPNVAEISNPDDIKNLL